MANSEDDPARMDAIRVIEALQSRYDPHIKYDPKRTDKFAQQFVSNATKKWNLPESFSSDYQKRMLETQAKMFSKYEEPAWFSVVSTLSERIEKNISDKNDLSGTKKILFGTLASGRINGMAIGIKNPKYYIVLIEDGVFGFANLLAKGIARMFPYKMGDDGQLNFSTDLKSVRERLGHDEELYLRIVDLILAYIIGGHPHRARPYLPEKEYVGLLSVWRNAMEYFVLAHEYGHAISGHLEAPTAVATSETGGKESPLDWQQEFQADYVGLVITLNILSEDNYSPTLTYAGVEAFFLGVELIERTLTLFRGEPLAKQISKTHPPADLRREALRMWLKDGMAKETSERAIDLATTLQDILDLIWPRLEVATKNLIKQGAKPHPKWGEY